LDVLVSKDRGLEMKSELPSIFLPFPNLTAAELPGSEGSAERFALPFLLSVPSNFFFGFFHFWRLSEESLALHSSPYHFRCNHPYPMLFAVGLRVRWLLRFHGGMALPILLRNHASVHQHSVTQQAAIFSILDVLNHRDQNGWPT